MRRSPIIDHHPSAGSVRADGTDAFGARPRLTTPLADSLVLVFTLGMSVKAWRATGMLEREWALYRALLPHYKRLVLVTYGGPEDQEILRELLTPEEASKVVLVCNHEKRGTLDYMIDMPARVRQALGDSKTVVIKTNQMMGGDAAVRLTDALREGGLTVGLIARGGYLWTRFVTYEHGPHSEAADDAAGREKLLCQAADVVVGTTPDMIEDLAWRYGLHPDRTRVIPNYVLTDEAPTTASEREKDLLLYAGQLVHRKRVHILIEAVAQLPGEMRERVRLEIVGDGPEKATLEALAARLEVKATFLPRMPHRELLQRMRRCTLYLQASDLEGHPKTVLEAMAAGGVVIVADAPGLGGVVDHGSTGLRVAGAADAFTNAISELLNDEDWRDLLGMTASRAVRARYGLEAILPQELDAHRLALAQAQARAQARSHQRSELRKAG